MLKYFVNSSFLFLLHIGMHLCLNFEADSLTLKGTTVKLVCDVGQTSFTTSVSLSKDGFSKSTCDNANSCFPSSSDSGRYQYFSNVSSVTVEIPNLNHTTDTGIWKCKLGQREEMDYKLDVITIPTYREFTQTIPDSNSSELVENVKLSGRCYCIFPPPSVKLYFRVGTAVAFQFREEISDQFINKRNETSSCEPYEFDVEVSNFTVKIMGTKNVFFEMHFGNYKTSGVVGPFSFSIKENESSNTGLIVGVTVGVIVVVIAGLAGVLVYKKKRKGGMSRDDNGDLENNTGSNTTKNEEGKQSPPTSASKIQLADKLKS